MSILKFCKNQVSKRGWIKCLNFSTTFLGLTIKIWTLKNKHSITHSIQFKRIFKLKVWWAKQWREWDSISTHQEEWDKSILWGVQELELKIKSWMPLPKGVKEINGLKVWITFKFQIIRDLSSWLTKGKFHQIDLNSSLKISP